MPIKKLTPAEEIELERLTSKIPIQNPKVNSKPANKIEVNDNTCNDDEIEQIISESIVEPEDRKPDWAICNLVKTESQLQREAKSANSSVKYMLIYVIFYVPVLVIIVTCIPNGNSKGKSKLYSNPLNKDSFSKAFSIFTGMGDSYYKPNLSNDINKVDLYN